MQTRRAIVIGLLLLIRPFDVFSGLDGLPFEEFSDAYPDVNFRIGRSAVFYDDRFCWALQGMDRIVSKAKAVTSLMLLGVIPYDLQVAQSIRDMHYNANLHPLLGECFKGMNTKEVLHQLEQNLKGGQYLEPPVSSFYLEEIEAARELLLPVYPKPYGQPVVQVSESLQRARTYSISHDDSYRIDIPPAMDAEAPGYACGHCLNGEIYDRAGFVDHRSHCRPSDHQAAGSQTRESLTDLQSKHPSILYDITGQDDYRLDITGIGSENMEYACLFCGDDHTFSAAGFVDHREHCTPFLKNEAAHLKEKAVKELEAAPKCVAGGFRLPGMPTARSALIEVSHEEDKAWINEHFQVRQWGLKRNNHSEDLRAPNCKHCGEMLRAVTGFTGNGKHDREYFFVRQFRNHFETCSGLD